MSAPAVAASSARWESRAAIPVPRAEVAAAASLGKVVVAGGPQPGLFVSDANEVLIP